MAETRTAFKNTTDSRSSGKTTSTESGGFSAHRDSDEYKRFRASLDSGASPSEAREAAGGDDSGGGLSGLWKDITGQTAVEQQNEANKELAKYQSDLNQSNWEKQNEYNTPTNQMKRLSDAGLNSNLLYSGSSSSGNASSMPGVSVPSYQRLPSGSEKINKVIGLLSTAMGITNGLYNLQAAKETVNNKLLSNENLRVDIQNKRFRNWQNELQSGLLLDKPNFISNLNPFKKKSPFYVDMSTNQSTLDKYSTLLRDANLEKLRTVKSFEYDFKNRQFANLGAQGANLMTQGAQMELDYSLNRQYSELLKQLGAGGKAAQIIFPILRTLFK